MTTPALELELAICWGRDKGIRIDPVECAPDFATGLRAPRLHQLAISLAKLSYKITLAAEEFAREERGVKP